MKLKNCAFTGPDDLVDPKDLVALSKEFPFVEWSLLYEPGDQGKARTPTSAWIRTFKEVCKDTHICMHLCGDALPLFVAGDREVLDIMRGFPRIQLNFEYLDAGGKVDPAALAARVKETPDKEFILQYGKGYKHYLPYFDNVPNHALLFDGSAGAGISPDKWSAPVPGRYCGYAGGLNPGNIKANLEMIAKVAPGYITWVDMESGVRTDDRFDLAKVRQVLEIAAAYALKPGGLAPKNPAAGPSRG